MSKFKQKALPTFQTADQLFYKIIDSTNINDEVYMYTQFT